MHLMHLPGPSRSISLVCCEGTFQGVPWASSGELISGCDIPGHPGSQEDMISNWQPAYSLVEDAVSGTEVAAVPSLPTLAVSHLPLYLWRGRTLNGSQNALL